MYVCCTKEDTGVRKPLKVHIYYRREGVKILDSFFILFYLISIERVQEHNESGQQQVTPFIKERPL